MRWFRTTWMVPLVIAAAAAPLVAQTPTGMSGDAVAGPAVPADADAADDRSVVIRFLERDDVRSVASKLRIDTDKLAGRVDEMSPAQQARVADRARELDQSEAAQNITLSTTTIIVGLLVLILLILIL